MDCCSRFCACCCPCCYNKDEVPYKNPRDAYAAVITPDTPPTGPMTKTVKMQQPPSSIQSSAKEGSDVSIIKQQPKAVPRPRQPRTLKQPGSLPKTSSNVSSSAETSSVLSSSSYSQQPSLDMFKVKEPSVQFGMSYYPEQQQLCVHSISYQIHGVGSKIEKETTSVLDTFLVVQLLPNISQSYRSKTRSGTSTRNLLEEVFTFSNISAMEIKFKTIVIQIFNQLNTGQQEYIGEVKHALSDADLSGTQTLLPISFDAQKQIGPKESPEILVSLGYYEQEKRLHGIILKAKNLQLPSLSGPVDVQVKAYLAEGQKKGSKKWNSSGKHAPPNPTFNQKFQFQVSQDASLENITLNIVVLAKSPEVTERTGLPLGMVQVGEGATEEGKELWRNVIESPHQQAARWLRLTPCKLASGFPPE